MNYLSAEDLEKSVGDKLLFNNLNIGLEKGDKLALIAANGTGKSSLLNILAGKASPDNGSVSIRKGIRLGYLEQHPQFEDNISILDIISSGKSNISSVVHNYQEALKFHAANNSTESQRKLEEASADMDRKSAWDFQERMLRILDKFAITDPDQIASTLSGGQKKRLALAILLLDEPEILLLDEPTNHLDINMIEWLEDYLSRQAITFLMVTHDRYFLDRICSKIIEMDNQTLYTYEGNYEYFLRKKEDREEAEQAATDRAVKYVKRELDWVRRMPKARTTKSKSRLDAFDETKKKASVRKAVNNLELEVNMSRLGSKILEIKHMSKSFGDLKILDSFSYTFHKGDRVGIVGVNGCGKTSLLEMLMGRLEPDSGQIVKGDTLVTGYYTQEGLQFDENKKVIEVITDISEFIETKKGNSLSASQFLQHFMFTPPMQHNYVSKLSGGERRRLHLMTVLMRNPNFLILDEPTNDLDIITLSKLEEFLEQFPGCLILVSHDRYFLDKLCDHLFIFEGNGQIKDHYGFYSDYQLQLIDSKGTKENDKTFKLIDKADNKSQETNKKLSYKEKTEYDQLSTELEELEKEKKDLEDIMNSGETDYEKLTKASERISKLIQIIDEKSMRWLELDERA
jgi:ABC transport system ATP-binding/permease protein